MPLLNYANQTPEPSIAFTVTGKAGDEYASTSIANVGKPQSRRTESGGASIVAEIGDQGHFKF